MSVVEQLVEKSVEKSAEKSAEKHPFLDLLHEHYAQLEQERIEQQAQAWKKFLQIGLPTRHNETYRYVRLADLWEKVEQTEKTEKTPSLHIASDAHIQEALHAQPPSGSRLVFVDGVYRADLSQRTGLPKNIVISDLKASFMQYGPFLETQWNTLLREESDPFALLNAACTQGALFLYIPPNSLLKEPIEFLHVTTGKCPLAFPRVHAVFGRGCEVTLLSRTLSLNTQATCTVNSTVNCTVSSCLDALVEEEARVHYIEPPLPQQAEGSQCFDALRVRLKRGSTFKAFTAAIGGKLIRKSWHAALLGEGAEVFFEGAVCLSEERQAHVHIVVEHEAPHCRSEQLFKSVLKDASRMSFGGNILVRKRAQKTEAYQLSQNLLLGEKAHIDATPRLEIFADDVKASHGATVGQLDPEQVLYFLTRGISEGEAHALLLAGFFESLTARIPLEKMRQEIQKQLEEAIV